MAKQIKMIRSRSEALRVLLEHQLISIWSGQEQSHRLKVARAARVVKWRGLIVI